MPKFVVMGCIVQDRNDWIAKLNADFGEKTAISMYPAFGSLSEQTTTLKGADAVFLIASNTDNSKKIHDQLNALVNEVHQRDPHFAAPFYVVLKDVDSENALQNSIQSKFTSKTYEKAENASTKASFPLYQIKSNTNNDSTPLFHDVFGYSHNKKFPADLRATLSEQNLTQRKGKIQESKKTEAKSSYSSPSSNGSKKKESASSKGATSDRKSQANGYTIVLKKSKEEFDANKLGQNELYLALDDKLLCYIVRDPSNKEITGGINGIELEAKSSGTFKYNEFVEAFNNALNQNNLSLLGKFLPAILKITTERKHTRKNEPAPSSGSSRSTNTNDKVSIITPVKEDKDQSDDLVSPSTEKKDRKRVKIAKIENSKTAASPSISNSSIETSNNTRPIHVKTPSYTPKNWSTDAMLESSLGSLLAFFLIAFVLEVVLPTGFLATGGVVAGAIAGTVLASLTPVGVFLIAAALALLVVAGVTFCVVNRESIGSVLFGSQENEKEAKNIELNNMANHEDALESQQNNDSYVNDDSDDEEISEEVAAHFNNPLSGNDSDNKYIPQEKNKKPPNQGGCTLF